MERIHIKIFIASVVLVCTFATPSNAQTTGNVMLGGGFDIIKSDINGFASKVQMGFEANYFVTRNFSVSGGFEIWSANNNSLVFGVRWYPVSKFFTRFRGLIGADDIALGIGYSHVLNSHWRAEGMSDYYFDQGELGLRGGVAYVFRK